MITNIAGGAYLYTSPGNLPYITPFCPLPTSAAVGDLRLMDGRLYVLNSAHSWEVFRNEVTVNLSGDVWSVIVWAKKKMAEEDEFLNLVKNRPELQSLYNEYATAKGKLSVINALIKDQSTTS